MNLLARTALSAVIALPLAADPIGDVRAALAKLTAREPIRATYEVQQSIVNEGKFDNDKFSGKATVELEGEHGEFRVVLPRPLLDQIAREGEARTKDFEQATPTISALAAIEPGETSNAIDFAPTLLRMLHGA